MQQTDTIGKRIKYIRTNMRRTQKVFSDALDISQGTLSDIEKDKSYPSVETLLSLMKYSHVSADWILTGMGEGPDSIYSPETIEHELEKYEKKIPLASLEFQSYYKSLPKYRKWDIAESMLLSKYLPSNDTPADDDLKLMIDILTKLMSSNDSDLRGWAKIQFKKAFGDLLEKAQQDVATNPSQDSA